MPLALKHGWYFHCNFSRPRRGQTLHIFGSQHLLDILPNGNILKYVSMCVIVRKGV